MAMASAGPYASLHLAPDRQPHQHPTTLFLQAGCPSCRPTNSVKALKATLGEVQLNEITTTRRCCALHRDIWSVERMQSQSVKQAAEKHANYGKRNEISREVITTTKHVRRRRVRQGRWNSVDDEYPEICPLGGILTPEK